MQQDKICRLVLTNSQIVTEGPSSISMVLSEVIENDKKYGVMVPRNGEYFTFRILDVHDKEVTEKMLNKAVQIAFGSYEKRTNVEVRKAREGEYADFKLQFRTPQNDELGYMDNSTIMYAFFPISDFANPNRGLVVINPGFFYTSHGNSISMHIIDPDHYDEDTKAMGPTIDLDGVLRHEFGHCWGLPHDLAPDTTMSTPYTFLYEFLDERTILRVQAKTGVKDIKPHILKRWINWIFHRSENY